jgi:hypothetical protein
LNRNKSQEKQNWPQRIKKWHLSIQRLREFAMNRHTELVNARYEAMMFAKSAEDALKAAHELVRLVLGEDAQSRSLQEALKETCRRIRPSEDPREQSRFEAEFVELGIWPNSAQKIAA